MRSNIIIFVAVAFFTTLCIYSLMDEHVLFENESEILKNNASDEMISHRLLSTIQSAEMAPQNLETSSSMFSDIPWGKIGTVAKGIITLFMPNQTNEMLNQLNQMTEQELELLNSMNSTLLSISNTVNQMEQQITGIQNSLNTVIELSEEILTQIDMDAIVSSFSSFVTYYKDITLAISQMPTGCQTSACIQSAYVESATNNNGMDFLVTTLVNVNSSSMSLQSSLQSLVMNKSIVNLLTTQANAQVLGSAVTEISTYATTMQQIAIILNSNLAVAMFVTQFLSGDIQLQIVTTIQTLSGQVTSTMGTVLPQGILQAAVSILQLRSNVLQGIPVNTATVPVYIENIANKGVLTSACAPAAVNGFTFNPPVPISPVNSNFTSANLLYPGICILQTRLTQVDGADYSNNLYLSYSPSVITQIQASSSILLETNFLTQVAQYTILSCSGSICNQSLSMLSGTSYPVSQSTNSVAPTAFTFSMQLNGAFYGVMISIGFPNVFPTFLNGINDGITNQPLSNSISPTVALQVGTSNNIPSMNTITVGQFSYSAQPSLDFLYSFSNNAIQAPNQIQSTTQVTFYYGLPVTVSAYTRGFPTNGHEQGYSCPSNFKSQRENGITDVNANINYLTPSNAGTYTLGNFISGATCTCQLSVTNGTSSMSQCNCVLGTQSYTANCSTTILSDWGNFCNYTATLYTNASYSIYPSVNQQSSSAFDASQSLSVTGQSSIYIAEYGMTVNLPSSAALSSSFYWSYPNKGQQGSCS